MKFDAYTLAQAWRTVAVASGTDAGDDDEVYEIEVVE